MPYERDSEHPYCCVVRYDGRKFFGWQRLKDKPSVQGALEQALVEALGERVKIQGAGRTDRGAHAEGQVIGFRLATAYDPDQIVRAMNEVLPEEIRILMGRAVPEGFHVRESAVGKRYEYRILTSAELPADLSGRVWHATRPLDLAAMQAALPALVGRHDFASFASKPRFEQKSTVRLLSEAAVEREGDLLTFTFEADGFLYHMVRNLVGAVAKVGEGRLRPEQIGQILSARDRAASPGSAPASGLYLMEVSYR